MHSVEPAYFFAPVAYHDGSLARQEGDITARVLTMAEIAAARCVVDVGCGAGQSLDLARALGSAALLVGVDPDRAALAHGATRNRDKVFLAGDGESLPLASGAATHVICRVAINYMHQARTLAELARIIAPGGTLVISFIRLGYTLRTLLRPQGGGPRQRLGRLKDLLAGLALQCLGVQARRGTFWGRSVPYTSPGWLSGRLQDLGCDIAFLGHEDRFLGLPTVSWIIAKRGWSS